MTGSMQALLALVWKNLRLRKEVMKIDVGDIEYNACHVYHSTFCSQSLCSKALAFAIHIHFANLILKR